MSPEVRAQIKPLVAKRFSVSSTIDGWEVIDSDGRPVTEHFEYEDVAHLAKKRLNEAALHGPRSLAFALGALDEEDLMLDIALEEVA